MKKDKKLILGIVLVALGVVGILGVFTIENITGLLIGALLLIASGTFFVIASKKQNENSQSAVNSLNTVQEENAKLPDAIIMKKETDVIPDGETDYDLLQDITQEGVLAYQYERQMYLVDGAFEHIHGNGGKALELKQEPENTYDKNAVAIYLGGKKIGYLRRGTNQDMCNDYINRGWPIVAYLNKYSEAEKVATYKIGYYKPFDVLPSKVFSISKTRKKIDEFTTREDNLISCSKGELLTIDEDFGEDTFLVLNEMSEEIGELPQSAINFITENDYKNIVGILESCEEDDNGKLKAKIRIYIVE